MRCILPAAAQVLHRPEKQDSSDVADSADGKRLPLCHRLPRSNGVTRPVGLEEATA